MRSDTQGVHRLVADRVRESPEAPAVREALTGRELTYRQLWERAGLLAARLAQHGVGPGDTVALDLPRGADLVTALLGVVRTGAAYLPLDSHAPADRVTALLEDARARAVVTGPPVGERRETTALAGAVLLTVAEADTAAPTSEASHPDVSTDETKPLCVGYTSGSTGEPKGVIVPHSAVRDLVTHPDHPGAIRRTDRVGQLANPAFDAFTWEVWGALTAGAPLIVLPTVVETPLENWTRILVAEGVTTALLTTSLFHMVAREAPGALGSLRQLLVGGEQLDLAATRRVLAAEGPRQLLNIYGPTETTVFVTVFACTEESLAGRTRIPVGTPVRRVRLHVLDDALRPVAPGETGELCVAGPSVTSGYLHRPERTARSYVTHRAADGTEQRVYRTGDLARLLPDGQYEIVGRTDRQVKLRGFRIELEEIEQAAVATGHTEAAFVEKLGEGHTARLAGAFLAPRATAAGSTADPARVLAEALAERLPSYMLPSSWLELAELPLGSTGKADRARIKQLLTEHVTGTAPASATGTPAGSTATAPTGPADPTAFAAPAAPAATVVPATGTDAVTATIAAVWAQLLGLPDPSAVRGADDFTGLGGNSILAVQAAFRIGERLGIPVEPVDVLLAADLDELAARLREGGVATGV
ncbi:amino acid adenylation domain-containing protein [Streptomyces sp. NPDC048192]|uniref:non-ribosomal peptide synthetase n=1 Tax=Streptomyces sp. NPDC048192 TaxID=3365510 RepID=UPI00371D715F